MKLSDTFALSAVGLAANFNGALALESSDLITDDGIIWNSDQTLCLKMSGKVFETKPDFSKIVDKRARNKARRQFHQDATCDHVTVAFSSECREFLDDDETASEADLPVEYKFRVSDHGGYFCIIGNGDDHPCSVRDDDGATYKVTKFDSKQLKDKGWQARNFKKVPKDLRWKGVFGLEPYGCADCKPLINYFKFEDETNNLIYGAFAEEEENNWNSKYIVWSEKYRNFLNLVSKDQLYNQDLLANPIEPTSCDVASGPTELFHWEGSKNVSYRVDAVNDGLGVIAELPAKFRLISTSTHKFDWNGQNTNPTFIGNMYTCVDGGDGMDMHNTVASPRISYSSGGELFIEFFTEYFQDDEIYSHHRFMPYKASPQNYTIEYGDQVTIILDVHEDRFFTTFIHSNSDGEFYLLDNAETTFACDTPSSKIFVQDDAYYTTDNEAYSDCRGEVFTSTKRYNVPVSNIDAPILNADNHDCPKGYRGESITQPALTTEIEIWTLE